MTDVPVVVNQPVVNVTPDAAGTAGGNAEGQTVDPTEEKVTSATELAQQVLAGQWGRGRRRDERLKAAGHDPFEVRKAYNELLGK